MKKYIAIILFVFGFCTTARAQVFPPISENITSSDWQPCQEIPNYTCGQSVTANAVIAHEEPISNLELFIADFLNYCVNALQNSGVSDEITILIVMLLPLVPFIFFIAFLFLVFREDEKEVRNK